MIYNTKSEFLTGLRIALEQNNITDTRDILTDFRQHFVDGEAAGESEADVCRKLGDIDEIIKQYISEDAEKKAEAPDASGFGADASGNSAPQYTNPTPQANNQYTQYANPNPAPANNTSGADAGKIVGVLCLDFFLYSWAIPTLFGLIIGLIGMAIGFVGTGVGAFFAGLVSGVVDISGFITTGFAPVSIALLGVLVMSLGGMLVIASIGAVKGFINLIIAIINQHARAFAGRNVLNKIGNKNKEAYAG